ncbi:MAG: DNA sulfur modification protein DndD, partial [Planctomyces sp.]|nr:DNA sulfur modification protein DndD [Planctomyces sp.]
DEKKAEELFDNLRDAERQLSRCEGKVDHVTESFEEKKRNLDEVQTDLKRLSRKLIDEDLKSEESQRVAQLALKVQGMTDRFLEEATRRKVDRLSKSVSGTLKELMHKSTLVDRVEIDPESFQITIFDAKKRVVPKERLSEGEKQLFAISVLWGLSRAASQQLPTIIDTPMARLDGEHRQRLLTEYFPAASHQVIILSTDTEVEEEGFQAIQPSIARAYHLDYDEESRVTRIEDGYFWSDQESHEPATEKVA